MSIKIAKIENETLRKLAQSIDADKNNGGNQNNYLDSSEISIFCTKINESLPEDKKIDTFLELAEFLGFKKTDAKANTRKDYDLVKNLPELTKDVTSDNVVYLLTEYKNKHGKYCEIPVILTKLLEKAKQLGITLDNNEKNVTTLVNKIIDATDNTYFVEKSNEDGVDKIVHMGDAELSVSETYYNDGRVVLTRNGKNSNGTTNSLVTTPENNVIAKRGIEAKANAITVALPHNAPKNVKKMAKALADNKQKLMNLLKIDNETYDKYVSFTLALIERETKFGEGCVAYDKDKKEFEVSSCKYIMQRFAASDGVVCNTLHPGEVFTIAPIVRSSYAALGDPISFGMSGIKWDSIAASAKANKPEAKFYKDVLEGFKDFDINSPKDLYEPEKCAIATLIYASKHAEIIKVLCENDTNASRKVTGNYDIDSRVKASPDGYQATELDIVANMWNRGPSFILDGALDVNWEHTKSVRENMKYYPVFRIAQLLE